MQVVREDPKNKDLLYVGTEFGLFVSLDGGKQWQRFMNNLPTARVDDILVHPRDNDLIVATHARSVLDRRRHHAAAAAGQRSVAQDVALFDIRPAIAYLTDRQRGQQTGGQKAFVGENPPRGTAINYYLKSAATGDVKITIADATGKTIRTLDGTKDPGINRVQWTLTPQPLGGRRAEASAAAAAVVGRRRSRHLHRHPVCERQDDDEAADGAPGHLDERDGTAISGLATASIADCGLRLPIVRIEIADCRYWAPDAQSSVGNRNRQSAISIVNPQSRSAIAIRQSAIDLVTIRPSSRQLVEAFCHPVRHKNLDPSTSPKVRIRSPGI